MVRIMVLLFVFIFAILHVADAGKSDRVRSKEKNGCCICKTKSMKSTKRFLESSAYEEEFSRVFGVSGRAGQICSACVSAIRRARTTGKKYEQYVDRFHERCLNSHADTPLSSEARFEDTQQIQCRRALSFEDVNQDDSNNIIANEASASNNQSSSMEEIETDFGVFQQLLDGNLLVPEKVLGQIIKENEILARRTDFRTELHKLKEAMVMAFTSQGHQAIYDPDEFEEFCSRHGLNSIFNTLVSAVSTPRQSKKRLEYNRKIVVSVLYQLCFAISQRCNYLQRDNTLFMVVNSLNQEAINTQRSLGSSMSSRTGQRMLHDAEVTYSEIINNEIQQAIENGWLIVATIDDYTSVHSHRRPKENKASAAINMCTIVISIFKMIPAVQWHSPLELHNPYLIEESHINLLLDIDHMRLATSTYATLMPEWLTESFFDPAKTRWRLNAHEYYQADDVQQLRSFDNLLLLEFQELNLKEKGSFETAIGWMMESKLSEYLAKYCILLPGDHPAQFFCRQHVYNKAFNYNAMPTASSIRYNELPRSIHQGIVPLMGPLHIQLNAQEDLMQVYHPIFKHLYEGIFSGSKLADSPKPWRTSLILEIVYGGWLLIRESVLKAFCLFKTVHFSMLITLLDDYMPLCLSIYAVTYKLNRFQEFKRAVFKVWVMFLNFSRKNYNKTPLIWLSLLMYWKTKNPLLYDTIANNISAFDEYRVENTHSIIRANTAKSDTPDVLTRKAKAIFSSKRCLHNFKSIFTPPKTFSFSRDALEGLKLAAANILCQMFEFVGGVSKAKSHAPTIFHNENSIELKMLPTGFHTNRRPNSNFFCDQPGCSRKHNSEGSFVLRGCGHSYHQDCISNNTCSICKQHIAKRLNELKCPIREGLIPTEKRKEKKAPTEQCDETEKVNYEKIYKEEIQAKVRELRNKIGNMTPRYDERDDERFIKLAQVKHCKRCTHSQELHEKKEKYVACQNCPRGRCSAKGKNSNCTCKEHSNITQCEVRKQGPVVEIQMGASQKSLNTDSELHGLASNACTLISALVGNVFLNNQLPFKEPKDLVTFFINEMKDGNHIYNTNEENIPMFLNADDAAKLIKIHTKGEIFDVTDSMSLSQYLAPKIHSDSSAAFIMIIPSIPAVSVAICQKGNILYLFDSHSHGTGGAIIAFCVLECIDGFTKYINDHVMKTWNTPLVGSNIIQLCK